jgi:hypothetical protein
MATETFKVLGQSNPVAATLTDAYTVPGATQAIVSTVVVCNRSATATAFRLAVAVAGIADDVKQYLAYDVPIAGNETITLTLGLSLGAADVVRVLATLATLSFNIFGEEIA